MDANRPTAARRHHGRSTLCMMFILSGLLGASMATAQTTTAAATTTTAGPATTAGPTTTAAPTAPVVQLSTDISRADLLFTFFAQDDTVVKEYSRTVAGLLNVTLRRVEFESTGQGRYGYLFGDDVRVRVIINPPVAGESELRLASEVRDILVAFASAPTHASLTEIGVVSGERVDTTEVYTYSPITAWDIIWSLAIAAGGVGFAGFLIFVAFRFHRWRKFERLEREQAAKEKEAAEVKRKAQANGSSKAAKKAAAAEHAAFMKRLEEEDDGDDVADGAMLDLVNQLAASVKRQQHLQSGDYSPGGNGTGDGSSTDPGSPRFVEDGSQYGAGRAASEAFTAPTDRVPMGESQLGPTSIDGRNALSLHHGGAPPQQRTAIDSYLDRMVLPPTTANATYIAGVDPPRAPPPSVAPAPSAATAASSSGGAKPSSSSASAPTSKPPASAAAAPASPSQVGTSALQGYPASTPATSTPTPAPTPAPQKFSKKDMDEL